MKIMVFERDPYEQKIISNMLRGCDVVYETTVAKAINQLGIEHIDFVLIDADSKKDAKGETYDWQELSSFLNFLNIDYTIFSSNGKVGEKNGQNIISINDIKEAVRKEKVLI